jgi:hypothetical protein
MQNRVVAAIALALAACGGGSAQTRTTTTETTQEAPQPASTAHARGDRSVSARVGRLGGSLELGNGARLEIDPNVLSEDVEITMTVGQAAHVFDTSEYQTPLGPLIEISPAVTPSLTRSIHFSVPYVRIPDGYPEQDLALAVEEDAAQREHFVTATQTHWQMHAARHIGDRFVSDLDALAGHRLQFGVSR